MPLPCLRAHQLSRQKLSRVRQEIGRLDGRNNHVANSRRLSSLEHRLDKMSVRLNQAVRGLAACASLVAPPYVGRPSHAPCSPYPPPTQAVEQQQETEAWH